MSERDINQLKALLERRLGVTWADIQEWLRSTNSLEEIERRLTTGHIGDLVQGVDVAGRKLADEMHQAYVTSGQAQAAWLDRKERTADTLVRFDTGHESVVARQRMNELRQVQGLTMESRDVIRNVLVEGAQTGVNPRETARRIRDSIGLTAGQEKWVSNYRRALEGGDYARALGYELSSGNADRSVLSAQSRGVGLSPDRVETMVAAYRNNAIAYRAETIARYEARGAAEAGAADAIAQSIQRGEVQAEELIVTWHSRGAGPRARSDHQIMDGQSVKFGVDFVLPDGTRMRGPHDPRGGVEHNAGCGCTSSTSFAL